LPLLAEYTVLKIFSPCPEKEFAVKFSTVLNICFLSFRIFEHLALALKNRVDLKIFPVLKYFFHSGLLSNLRLP